MKIQPVSRHGVSTVVKLSYCPAGRFSGTGEPTTPFVSRSAPQQERFDSRLPSRVLKLPEGTPSRRRARIFPFFFFFFYRPVAPRTPILSLLTRSFARARAELHSVSEQADRRVNSRAARIYLTSIPFTFLDSLHYFTAPRLHTVDIASLSIRHRITASD